MSGDFKFIQILFTVYFQYYLRDPKYASVLDIPKFIIMMAWPKLAKLMGITFLDKKCTEFFMNIVRTTMENRRFVYLSGTRIV